MSYTVKHGDNDTITFEVKDQSGPVDLTGATAKMWATPVGGGAAIELTPTTLGGPGEVLHTLTGDLEADTYKVVARWTDTNGKVHTSPTTGYLTLTVEPEYG